MKVLRPFLWAAVLVAGFVYVTSLANWNVGRLVHPGAGRLWSEPAAAAGGYSAARRSASAAVASNSRRNTAMIRSERSG